MSKHYNEATRRQMILDCRKSGMSDQLWCAEHGISTTTFYRWIKAFQAQACMELPEKTMSISPVQDVVKLEIVSDESCKKRDHFTPTSTISDMKRDYFTPTISLHAFGTEIHLCNDADPALVQSLLQILGGCQ